MWPFSLAFINLTLSGSSICSYSKYYFSSLIQSINSFGLSFPKKCGNIKLTSFSNLANGFEKPFLFRVQKFYFFFLSNLSFFSFIITLIFDGKVHPSTHLLLQCLCLPLEGSKTLSCNPYGSSWRHLHASGKTLVQTRNPNHSPGINYLTIDDLFTHSGTPALIPLEEGCSP